MLWVLSLCFFLSLRHVVGLEINRTIDDEYGDTLTGQKPIFLPITPGIWEGETCTGCPFQPDKNVAYMGTWNAATFRPEVPDGSGPLSIDLSFKGTAIYVFFITGNEINGGGVTTAMECNFTLDGEPAGSFQHSPDNTTNYQYSVLAFKQTGLRNVGHTVRATTGGVDHHLLLNFDYAMYTFDDTPESTTTSSPTPPAGGKSEHGPPLGAIIGGVLGGLAVVLCFTVLLCLFRNKRRRRRSPRSPRRMHTIARYAITPSTREVPQEIHSFTHGTIPKSIAPLPSGSSRNRDTSSLPHSANYHSEPSSSGYSSSPAGVESRRGQPDPNVPPRILQTGDYTQNRRSQRGIEEPPPQYWECVQ